jgi:hypothetical protein
MGHRFHTAVTAQVTRAVTALVAILTGIGVLAASPWDGAQIVPREVIVTALRQQQAQGYRIDAIANSVRLQSGVMLAIADAMRTADPQPRPYRIDHRDYYAAFLEVSGLTPETAPSFVKAPHAAREDYLIDARLEQVVDLGATADRPQRALNVKAGWPPAPGERTSYSYEDHSTDPAIETQREQVTSWRILDYGQAIVYDDVRGVGGRATSGLLGIIFSLIGHAQAQQTRFAIAADGTQVSRTTAHKLLTLTQTITIRPDGRVLTGLPDDRPDLAALERMLTNLPVQVSYQPMDRSPMPPAER